MSGIGVARILSGGAHLLPSQKSTIFFSHRPQNYLSNHSHRPDLPNFLKNWTLALPGGALTTFPCKFGSHFFLRPGGARAPSTPPGYAYDVWLEATQLSAEDVNFQRNCVQHETIRLERRLPTAATTILLIFSVRLHVMQCTLLRGFSACLSVCLSVCRLSICLTRACIVTKRKKFVPTFSHHMNENSS